MPSLAHGGVKAGFTQPRSANESVLARARAAASAPVETDPLLKPFEGAGLPADRLGELNAIAITVVRDLIRPAQRDFALFVEREYLPASRKGLGTHTLPGGEAYYRWLAADHTTTSLTPDQIHDLGLAEGWGLYAERLAGEMGLYRDDYERFGELSMEMWRACRLVADTGIHWKGWSVARAMSR